MRNKTMNHPLLISIMLGIGVVTTLLTIVMRVWLMPVVMDWETGLFPANYTVSGMMLLALVALCVLGFLVGGERREVVGMPAFGFGGVSLLAGATLAVTMVAELLSTVGKMFVIPQDEVLTVVLSYVQSLFGVLGGITLVVLGIRLFSEGGTRRGIVRLAMLTPVLWMWFRLVNYEMSHASLVRLEDSFFGFVMLIMEMLFLYKLACYVAGVGKLSTGSLLFYSLGTAIFALSGPVVRLIAYLQNDTAAYDASLATVADFGIGLLALVVAWTIASSARDQLAEVAEEEFSAASATLVSLDDEEEDE